MLVNLLCFAGGVVLTLVAVIVLPVWMEDAAQKDRERSRTL